VDLPELRIIDQELWQAVQDRLEGVRQSARSRKIRKSEFWKNRRPKHLLTGLIHCAQCGNAMAAVGSDYLACSAARNGAGCNNTKGIKRTIIEHGVLEGLKTRLMAPDLVEEFVRAFHAEVNKQLAEDDAAHRQITQELQKISTKLDGLYNAIADGLRTKGLRTKLEQLEKQQSELQDKLTEAPPLSRGCIQTSRNCIGRGSRTCTLHYPIRKPEPKQQRYCAASLRKSPSNMTKPVLK
jgi:site-specific DNA recombinase